MNEHPKSICLRVANNKKIAYNEVDTLSITHWWEIVSYTFEYIFEYLLFFLFKLESSIEIFFDLSETLVVLIRLLEFAIRFVLNDACIDWKIFLVRYQLFFIPNLKSQTFFINIVSLIQAIQNNLPLLQDETIQFFLTSYELSYIQCVNIPTI